jgi:hypothetical protein
LKRSTRLILFSAIAAGAIFVVAAAYGSQTSGQNKSFDSDLLAFMKRTDTSLLKIARQNDSAIPLRHVDEYSLATSNAAFYKYLSAVDKAYDSSAGESGQVAHMEVVISRSETRAILGDMTEVMEQQDPSYETYVDKFELSGRNYSLELLVPK